MSIIRATATITTIALISIACSNSNARDAGRTPEPAAATLSDTDQMFIDRAAASGHREVEHAEAAQANAGSAAVKEYASRLRTDHTAANEELARILERKGASPRERDDEDKRGSIGARNDATTATKTGGTAVAPGGATGTTGASGTVATTGEARARERAGTSAPWLQAKGAAFDEGYVAEQIKAHQDAIALFEQQASRGADADLKAFAAAQLPALREHLRQAEELQRSLRTASH